MNLQYQELGRAQAAAIPQGPKTQIRAELDMLEDRLGAAFGRFDTLIERLTPVMIPRGNGSCSAEKQAAPAPVRCDLAEQLHRHNDALSAFRERIDNLLISLEI